MPEWNFQYLRFSLKNTLEKIQFKNNAELIQAALNRMGFNGGSIESLFSEISIQKK